jgi:DNA mismatch repair protein MutS2
LNEKALQTLEFTKIRERLAGYTSFSAGRELALELVPSDDIEQVRRGQRITTEAVRLLSLRPDVSIGAARDVRDVVRRAELGSALDPQDILMVWDTLRAGRVLRDAVVRAHSQHGGLDTLAFMADGITTLPQVESEIQRCINSDGEVLDSASPALAKIRANIRTSHNRLMAKLQQIISSPTYSRALQEPIISIRDGRYVVPVRREFQGQLRGIVHDQSNSGATVFIEPLAVVDLANEWRQWQMEEEQEIERILRELAALIGRHADAIHTNVQILADVDLALAKARYSLAINGVEPELVPAHRSGAPGPGTQPPALLFKNARHPLLAGHVVPITVELGERFRILVITGPNTGGKTVALKTVGLLTLMAQAGLHIPADPGSRAVVFKDVFADIGDEQSIEQSLSTFSSHMSNIVQILKQAGPDSLILLDELGAGTDPQEGSALARAIIGYLLDLGALAVCTTHYSELKAFAFSTPGVQNASVEFDIETLSPTYHLTIGVPGRSNAFAIAGRLGLDPAIIERASRYIDPQAQGVEDVLEQIRRERETARAERSAAERARRELERRRQELERHLADIEQIKTRAAEEARAQVYRELDALREELRRLRGRVEAGLAATSDEVLSRQWVREAQQRVEELDRQVRAKAVRHKKPRPAAASGTPQAGAEPRALRPGDLVYVPSLDAEGEVIGSLDGGQVEVQVGAFKMRVPASSLTPRRSGEMARQVEQAGARTTDGGARYATLSPATAPPLEYDFRGWRAEEAIREIDRRLNEAALAGMPFLRIIHGKGTGALRTAMRQFLKSHPLVKEVEPAPLESGGEGVTIVKL